MSILQSKRKHGNTQVVKKENIRKSDTNQINIIPYTYVYKQEPGLLKVFNVPYQYQFQYLSQNDMIFLIGLSKQVFLICSIFPFWWLDIKY